MLKMGGNLGLGTVVNDIFCVLLAGVVLCIPIYLSLGLYHGYGERMGRIYLYEFLYVHDLVAIR
jgi:hypothetical protein